MEIRILIADDEKLIRETLQLTFEEEGYLVWTAANPYEAFPILEQHDIDIIITDLRMPSMDGLEFQRKVRERWERTEFIFITAFGSVETAVEAMRRGAADYLNKPLNTEELLLRVGRLIRHREDLDEMRRLRLSAARSQQVGDVVCRSTAMSAVVDRAIAVSDTDATVLIEGETGTGKEMLAHLIHDHSRRSSGPFVAVNCSGLNPNLIESELFGHEAGAFTGATHQRKGRIELAAGGTLLIDEVDDLAPDVQVRLLRFLQDRSFERVGSSRMLTCDVRILCATKKSLPDLIQAGRFREDLYYRINTIVINLPPLRKRREDIVPLAIHFASRFSKDRGEGSEGTFRSEALRAIQQYDWPGNVRELQHAVEHAVAFSRGRPVEPEHLPAQLLAEGNEQSRVDLHLQGPESVSFNEVMLECERKLIEWALEQAGGNQAQAAEILALPRTTLRSRLDSLRRDDKPES